MSAKQRFAKMKRMRSVNDRLWQIGNRYHESIPLHAIDEALTDNGFMPLEHGIYTGRDGKLHESLCSLPGTAFEDTVDDIGEVWLSMTWHQMEQTKRWEIVAYVS